MKILIAFLILVSTAFADQALMLMPIINGRPPVVDGDYDWSFEGYGKDGQKDVLVKITAKPEVIEALKKVKGVTSLTKDEKTGEVYTVDLKVLTAASCARITDKPIEYKVDLKVIEAVEAPKEEVIEK